MSGAGGAPAGREGPAAAGPWAEAGAPCPPQPHERDALLAGSLGASLHLADEQERDDWPADGPKAPAPCAHHRGHGHRKHPSGSNVSFRRDPDGCEDEPGKVRGRRAPRGQARGVRPPCCSYPRGAASPGVRPKHSFPGSRRGLAGLLLWLPPPRFSLLVLGAGGPCPLENLLPGEGSSSS